MACFLWPPGNPGGGTGEQSCPPTIKKKNYIIWNYFLDISQTHLKTSKSWSIMLYKMFICHINWLSFSKYVLSSIGTKRNNNRNFTYVSLCEKVREAFLPSRFIKFDSDLLMILQSLVSLFSVYAFSGKFQKRGEDGDLLRHHMPHLHEEGDPRHQMMFFWHSIADLPTYDEDSFSLETAVQISTF